MLEIALLKLRVDNAGFSDILQNSPVSKNVYDTCFVTWYSVAIIVMLCLE